MIRALVQLISRKSNASLAASLLFMVMLISTLCFPVQSYAVEDLDRDEVLSYASDLLTGMVMTDNFEELFDVEVVEGNFYLGKQIHVFRKANEELVDLNQSQWPIYDGEMLVAVLHSATDDEGDTVYRLSSGGVGELEAARADDHAVIAILDDNDDCRYVFEDSATNFRELQMASTNADAGVRTSAIDNEAKTPVVLASANEVSQSTVDSASIDGAEPLGLGSSAVRENSQRAALTPQLLLPLVYQGQEKTCWAGTVASMGWYLTSESMSAHDLAMKILGTTSHGGSVYDAVRAFALFSYPSSTTTISAKVKTPLKSGDAPITDAEIKRWIGNGIPIFAHLEGSPSGNHGVAVCGWYTIGGGLAVYVMNPGHGAYEVMTKNSSGLLRLYYNSKDYNWKNNCVVLVKWQKPFGLSKWSYFYESGARATGWLKDGGYWYYFDSSGYMYASSWVKDGGSWYYVNSAGVMQTGWTKVGGYWYYMNSSGVMQKGWVKLDGSWYYLRPAANTPASGPEGAMLANGTWTINGKAYKFNSSGVCLNP